MNKSYVLKNSIGLFAALIIFISAACFNSYAENIDTTIRVGLNYSTTALDSAKIESRENSMLVGIVGYGEPFQISVNTISLSISNKTIYAKTIFGGDVTTVSQGQKLTIFPNDSSNGLTINDKHYYGGFELFSDSNGKIVVVNVVDVEEYIKGVLPSEIYPSWPQEALKVAAVVSRTFALRNALSSSHSGQGFDVCNNTHCQMYDGTRKETQSTNDAIDLTAGQVLMYNGDLATTPYHSSTGGYTASAADAWGGNPEKYPYLTNVTNPYENYRDVPNGKWVNVVSKNEILEYLSPSNKEKLPAGNLSFYYNKLPGGYITEMTIIDMSGNTVNLSTADRIRIFFSKLVKSANFGIGRTYIPSSTPTSGVTVISSSGTYNLTGLSPYEYITAEGTKTATGFTEVYAFDGQGYGHGVGLSQFGNRDMANAGFTYEVILNTYFPGTELTNITTSSEN